MLVISKCGETFLQVFEVVAPPKLALADSRKLIQVKAQMEWHTVLQVHAMSLLVLGYTRRPNISVCTPWIAATDRRQDVSRNDRMQNWIGRTGSLLSDSYP